VRREAAISFLKNAFPVKFPGIKIIPTTKTEIKSIIQSPKSKNSSGYDEITSKILQTCSALISHPLANICNNSLYTGIFPDRLKMSVVRPLYKKSDKISMTNYRPISLLTTFSKVLYKVIYNRLSHHMYINNILVPEQYGFRKGVSIEKCSLQTNRQCALIH
jgi:Notch-like protein